MINFYITKAIDWISFRTFKKFNQIKISTLKPNYWDKDTILLHAVMQLVVDYVEIELAALEIKYKNPSFKEKCYIMLPWCFRTSKLIRSREKGLQHIQYIKDFETNTEEIEYLRPQIESMKTLEKVYLWWKDVYPNRVDPDVLSGFHPEYKDDQLGLKAIQIESEYYKEENEMLNLVISIRDSLWT